jgi:hypothetical protein
VKGSEFLRRLQPWFATGVFAFDTTPSLGSHGRVWLDMESTTLKDPKKELGRGLLRAMCRDLKIEIHEL